MKKALLILAILTSALCVQAQQPQKVPAYRGVIERVQPDGYKLQTYLRGDERRHYAMTLDGWQIKENSKGYMCYAQIKKDGSVVASKKVAHNAEDRKKSEVKWLTKKGIKKI